jgi:hypothetical protein
MDRILQYFHHMWSRSGGIDDKVILQSLPRGLRFDIEPGEHRMTSCRTEVARHMHGGLISKVAFFKNANPSFIDSLGTSVLH